MEYVVPLALTYDDVLLIPQYSKVASRKDCDTGVVVGKLRLEVPVVAANMSSVISPKLIAALSQAGGIAAVDQLRDIAEEQKLIKEAKSKGWKVAGCAGVSGDFQERARAVVEAGADMLIFDTPHADSEKCMQAVRWARKQFPKSLLAAGNVATAGAALRLIKAGVDIVKVGVGPGAACMTRVNTGVGFPQWSAVKKVVKVAKKMGKWVIADGGVGNSGNFAKALGAGADMVMCGSLFAGCEESPGEMVIKNGIRYKAYWGSASETGKIVRKLKDKSYTGKEKDFVEGESGLVKYRGTVAELVESLQMGLKSAMSYSNSKTIKEFQKKAKFVQVTTIGFKESGAHGLLGGI